MSLLHDAVHHSADARARALQSLDFKWKYGLISSEGLLQVTINSNAMHSPATLQQNMLSSTCSDLRRSSTCSALRRMRLVCLTRWHHEHSLNSTIVNTGSSSAQCAARSQPTAVYSAQHCSSSTSNWLASVNSSSSNVILLVLPSEPLLFSLVQDRAVLKGLLGELSCEPATAL